MKRGLNGREAVGAVEVATGCDLDLFEGFWLGSPGETDVHVGPYVKRDLIALSYIVNDFSQMYGTTARDIRKLLARVNNFHPDRLAAVKAYLDCEYVTDRDTSDEKTYRWSDFLEIAGGDARYAAMLIERTAPGEPQEGLHPETLVDQDIRDGEAFMLAGRPIAPEDIYDLPGTVHGLYSELVDNVGRSGTLARDWRGFSAGTDADDVLREIDGAFGETEYSRAGTVLGAYADDTFMSPFFAADDAARDVTPLTPWEDENGVAFLSRTFDADAAAVVPCLWYCRRDEGQGFEVGGVKLDCSKIGFDEVSNEAASNGFDCVLAYLEQSISGSEPLCDIAVRRADAGRADAVKHFGRQDEALAMLSAIAGCRIEAYGVDTLTYRALLDNAAVDDYNEYIADRDGVNVDVVSSLDFFMNEVWKEIDYAIDNDLFDEISRFDRMLRDLKCGDDPEHPTEISVVAKGTVERWDRPSCGLVVADSLLSLVQGTGSADALKDCQIDRIIDTNGELHIEASHHDGSAYLDVRLISGISYDAKGFKLGGEYYAPGKMSTGDFHILLDNIYDSPDVGPCSLPRFAQRAYGSAQESYRFGETKFDIYQVAAFPDLPYIAKISTGEGACEDAGPRFASVGEAKEWCYQYSLRELAGAEKKPDPAEAAAAAKRAAGSTGGDGAGDAGAIKL